MRQMVEGLMLFLWTIYSFTNICQINDDIYSFPTNSIYHLYLDAGNNMWAGSIRGGFI